MERIELICVEYATEYYPRDYYINNISDVIVTLGNAIENSYGTANMIINRGAIDRNGKKIDYIVIEYDKLNDMLELLKRLNLDYKILFRFEPKILKKIENFPEFFV